MIQGTTANNSTKVIVESPNVTRNDNEIVSVYEYQSTLVNKITNADGSCKYVAKPHSTKYRFTTTTKVPKLGLMLVGWGGNNGSTLTAALLANKKNLSWETRNGVQKANYLGSLVMSTALKLGVNESNKGEEIFVGLRELVPMVHPNDIVVGGWDISKMNLSEAMDRACVLEPDLKRQLRDEMRNLIPLPSIYSPHFIASNQGARVDNDIKTTNKSEQLMILRNDIRSFKEKNKLDKVIVLWTATTERFSDVYVGLSDTAESLLQAIKDSNSEISPSTMFAVAAILEGCDFINGSPQNTIVPGVIDLAHQNGVHVAGDDFKSGQTKFKSVMLDFLVNAGIKPLAVTSYNHLGNNDGKNLSEAEQFHSKEVSKSSVMDDVFVSNPVMFGDIDSDNIDRPDHTVVIKYVPKVGDAKRALDEYESEIFMGGRNTISTFNMCEDSLLASPLIIDLVILCELFSRVKYESSETKGPMSLHSVLTPLSYLLKAPLAPKNTPVINSLFRQRACIESILRALVGLNVNNEANFEWKCLDSKF